MNLHSSMFIFSHLHYACPGSSKATLLFFFLASSLPLKSSLAIGHSAFYWTSQNDTSSQCSEKIIPQHTHRFLCFSFLIVTQSPDRGRKRTQMVIRNLPMPCLHPSMVSQYTDFLDYAPAVSSLASSVSTFLCFLQYPLHVGHFVPAVPMPACLLLGRQLNK